MSKLLFRQGNLHTGSVYGVQVVEQFGSIELHGPFISDTAAWNYGMGLATESDGTQSFKLVRIETSHVRTIARAEEVREYRRTQGTN